MNWFQLLSHPVVVEAEGLLVVATTIPACEWDVSVEAENLEEQKRLRLATDELLTYAKYDRGFATNLAFKLAYAFIRRVEVFSCTKEQQKVEGVEKTASLFDGECRTATTPVVPRSVPRQLRWTSKKGPGWTTI